MATVTLPTVDKSRVSMRLVRGDNALEALTGSEVIVEDLAAIWVLSFRPLPQTKEEARIWKSRLAQLSRLTNTFEMSHPDYDGPSTGYAGPTPAVKGGSQLGRSLDCDGVTPSAAIAKEGDLIGVNGELKVLTADATADGSGDVTFAFEPALRDSPADNAAVEIDNPVATFRLQRPIAEWEIEPPYVYTLQVDARETF